VSVATVKDRLALIIGTEAIITGVKKVPQGVPRALTAADLPTCVILTGRGVSERIGADLVQETRLYRLILLVKSVQTGIELEAEALCEPFFDRFHDAFEVRPGLHTLTNTDPLAGVQEALLLEDTGTITIEFSGVDYAGIEFSLQVVSLARQVRGA
jgi:hypothetical protein